MTLEEIIASLLSLMRMMVSKPAKLFRKQRENNPAPRTWRDFRNRNFRRDYATGK